MLAAAKKNAVTVPIYTSNAVSDAFKPVAGMEQTAAR
jgi:hypothetical protein